MNPTIINVPAGKVFMDINKRFNCNKLEIRIENDTKIHTVTFDNIPDAVDQTFCQMCCNDALPLCIVCCMGGCVCYAVCKLCDKRQESFNHISIGDDEYISHVHNLGAEKTIGVEISEKNTAILRKRYEIIVGDAPAKQEIA